MADVMQLLSEWMENATDPDILAELNELNDSATSNEQAIKDAFFQDLAFGTAGLRGIIGAGTNRMNIYTVGRATQGFADYLNATFDDPSIAIARDSRNMGDEFQREAASVLAANGVRVHIYPRIEPTPALSWAVRDLKCSGGICMTASHNPAPYNGYKAYGADGCQIASEAAAAISAAIAKVNTWTDVKRMDFDEAVAAGAISWIGEDTLDRYIDAVAELGMEATPAGEKPADLKLVYTPLCGTGLECVNRILERIGVTDISVVPEQAEPNGNFPTCEYPNPEIRAALEKGIQLCEQVHPDLLVATDPDADRVGIAVKDEGEYVLLTGNETGILLLDYICRTRVACGEDLSRAVAVTTIVSSSMVDALAAEYGFEAKRVLTGFKYIGEIIAQLEAEGEPERFIFGFEESYGYLSGSHVRDKDAINATMLICQMARYYRAQGMNLAQAMRALYEKHGYYQNKTISVEYPGASGAERMSEIMATLRAREDVTVDYKPGVNGLPSANVLEFAREGGCKLIVRPSGTEPKIKVYFFGQGPTPEAAAATIEIMEEEARQMLA